MTGRRAALAVLALVALGVLAGAAAAQSNGTDVDYYDNRSVDEVQNETWMDGNENVTGESVITFASRVGTFVVGGDGGSSGPLLTGMLLLGAGVGVATRADFGIVGGGVLALVSLWGVVGAGLAPEWLAPVFMFGVALLFAAGLRRVLR